ncbi:hypothetical protein CERZMDRAFT_95496 [Cercospora zeae-maydis SCOH1-5]|uniref:Uncharacterized protein n=1 Tax=Cercospora zeae-maydis SCOH1-5 TaxID=717836 RepID=A0A6A6FLN9_9PEZI|nr:hypothetical protein CERZMDRAFT_95496 [Cercospora zeae-maydis SCOH1-5]
MQISTVFTILAAVTSSVLAHPEGLQLRTESGVKVFRRIDGCAFCLGAFGFGPLPITTSAECCCQNCPCYGNKDWCT